MDLHKRCKEQLEFLFLLKDTGYYPYFRTIEKSFGTEVEVAGQRMIMVGSNDYLGLSHHPKVQEAAADAARRWGSGTGGSRFLCGNLAIHEELEERLADFVGKKKAVVHATGFMTNLGSIASLLDPKDVILCDREDHASIFEGCKASGGRVVPFKHNDPDDALRKLDKARTKSPDGCVVLVTEGVFSMSGDLAELPGLMKIKEHHPDMMVYLDDAHGLGVMGPGGRGTVAHFGLNDDVDFIMGTFSKAFASVGGFLAGDDELLLEFVRHQSRPLIFSAALPASNVAAVLAALDLIEEDPDMVTRLMKITEQVRAGYKEVGLYVANRSTPIIPIYIGQEIKAFAVTQDLFDQGVYALPAIFPAVPRGQAVIRTAFMSTHQPHQIERVLDVIQGLANKYSIRIPDLVEEGSLPESALDLYTAEPTAPQPTPQAAAGTAAD